MGFYLRIDAGKNVVHVFRDRAEKPSLQFLQSQVGGYIETVVCRKFGGLPFDMYCDEEGKLKRKDVNMLATKLMGCPGDVVVGDVVIVAHDDDGIARWLTDSETIEIWKTIKEK